MWMIQCVHQNKGTMLTSTYLFCKRQVEQDLLEIQWKILWGCWAKENNCIKEVHLITITIIYIYIYICKKRVREGGQKMLQMQRESSLMNSVQRKLTWAVNTSHTDSEISCLLVRVVATGRPWRSDTTGCRGVITATSFCLLAFQTKISCWLLTSSLTLSYPETIVLFSLFSFFKCSFLLREFTCSILF